MLEVLEELFLKKNPALNVKIHYFQAHLECLKFRGEVLDDFEGLSVVIQNESS